VEKSAAARGREVEGVLIAPWSSPRDRPSGPLLEQGRHKRM
jgi:hypothetical protein